MKGSSQKDQNYESIFKAHYQQLYLYALRLVHSPECAADITNDVFCYFWEKYDQLNLSTSPLPWLYSIVRNYCVNYLRHKEVEQKYQNKIHPADWYAHSLQEEIEHERKIIRIMKNIELLPPQTRRVFNEYFIHRRKQKEIAEELQISINTVKTHIMRALQILREKENR